MKERKEKSKKTKRKKAEYVDDGHTVYDMSGLTNGGRPKPEADNVGLSGAERRAAIRAALGRFMPIVLMTVMCFGLAAVLICLWLMH